MMLELFKLQNSLNFLHFWTSTTHSRNDSPIPSELILKIFYFLDAREVCACQKVSRNWHIIGQDNLLWKHLLKKHFPFYFNSFYTTLIENSWLEIYKQTYKSQAARLKGKFEEMGFKLIKNINHPGLLNKHFSSDGTKYFECSENAVVDNDTKKRTTLILKLADAVPLFRTYALPNDPFKSAVRTKEIFSLDNKQLATLCQDRHIRIWDTNTGECLQVLDMKIKNIAFLFFVSDSQKIIAVSWDEGKICRWDGNKVHEINILNFIANAVARQFSYFRVHTTAAALSRDGSKLAIATDKPCCCIWDLVSNNCLYQFTWEKSRFWTDVLKSITFSNDSKQILVLSRNRASLFNIEPFHLIWQNTHSGDAIAFSPDDTQIYSGFIGCGNVNVYQINNSYN